MFTSLFNFLRYYIQYMLLPTVWFKLFFRRFTGLLAEKARYVIAVNFMDTFNEKNQEKDSHYDNVHFVQEDVTLFNQTKDR